MESRTGVLPIAALTLLAGAALSPRFLTSTASPVVALSAQVADAGDSAGPAAAGERSTEAIDLLSDFFGVDTSGRAPAERLAAVHQAAARSGATVRFLIATVPDPIDSHAGWQFDTVLDAIQQGISDTGWVLDRFYIPDVTATRSGAAVASGRAHERSPGVIVFRDTGSVPRPGCTAVPKCSEVLVLFLAAETPTAGVHQLAFARAVQFVAGWSAEPQIIPILGPTFSGSSASLGRVIASLSAELPQGSGFRFVSGSATSRKNQQVLQTAAPNVTFQATALPDDVLMTVPLNYLLGMSHDAWEHGIALLAESNTDYAHEVTDSVTLENLNLTVLPFPMHVSRLRSDAAKAEAEPPSPSGQLPRFRPLSLAEAVTPTDQLPSLTPNTTSSYVELRLANILETVRRQDIRTVGIVATDSRDKLFLAQELARQSPDVTLFTVENDLLYTHPQYASYMARAIVASTYPLYTTNQLWTADRGNGRRRLQFPSAAAEGIYNAALALLAYNRDGSALTAAAPRLVDYSAPGQACTPGCLPPVWISIVGRSLLWPVRYYATRPDAYVFMPRVAASPLPLSAGPTTFPSAAARALYVSMTVLALLHIGLCVAIARRARQVRRGRRSGVDEADYASSLLDRLVVGDLALRRRRYLLPCVLGLAMIHGFATIVAWLSLVGGGPAAVNWQMAALFAPFAGLCLCGAWIVYSAALVPLTEQLRRWRGHWASFARWSMLVDPYGPAQIFAAGAAAALCTWGTWNLAQYASSYVTARLSGDLNPLLLVERSAQLGNSVSPMVPVLLLGGAVYLWGLIELRRLFGPRPVLLDGNSVIALVDQCAAGGVASIVPRLTLLERSVVIVPRWTLVPMGVAAMALLLFGFDPFAHPLVTVEGMYFNRFITSFVILLHIMIAASLFQLAYLWVTLKPLLARLAAHPLVDAYSRLPKKLVPQTVLPRRPTLLELHPLIAYSDVIATPSGPLQRPLSSGPGTLQAVYEDEIRTTPRVLWSSSRTWEMLVEAATNAARDLAATWQARSTTTRAAGAAAAGAPALAMSTGGTAVMSPAAAAAIVAAGSRSDATPASITAGTVLAADVAVKEELIAVTIVLAIRDALSRLAHNVLYIAAGTFLVFGSHMLFPFQAKQRLLALIWVDILVGVAVVLTVLFQMEKDEVLSRMTSTTPGRVTWNRETIVRVVVYGLVPLLTLFAAQFPEVGSQLLEWLKPIQRSIP